MFVLRSTYEDVKAERDEARTIAERIKTTSQSAAARNADLADQVHQLRLALILITEQETPSANATVKRMADIAHKAFG